MKDKKQSIIDSLIQQMNLKDNNKDKIAQLLSETLQEIFKLFSENIFKHHSIS